MIDKDDDTDRYMDAGKKITLKKLFNALISLDIFVEKSAQKLGEQFFENETQYFELSKPHVDNALPLSKHA